MPTEPTIRRGIAADAGAVAALLRRVREQNVATIPAGIHPPASVRAWVRDTVLVHQEVWVAERCGELVGVAVLGRPDRLEHLYVDAAATGAGLGGRFVELAKAELKGHVQLWTFASNTGAQRFYERHGFVAVERTDGANEEGQPDIRYLYTPPCPPDTDPAQPLTAP